MRYVTHQEFRRYVRGSMAAFVVMLASVGYVLSTKPDTGALRAGLVSSCERVNILRAQSNISDSVSFEILSLSGKREAALGKPGKPDAKLHKDSATLLFGQADKLTITGLTNCKLAVDSARTYKFPVASPIGVPETGDKMPMVDEIIEDSRRLLRLSGEANTSSG